MIFRMSQMQQLRLEKSNVRTTAATKKAALKNLFLRQPLLKF